VTAKSKSCRHFWFYGTLNEGNSANSVRCCGVAGCLLKQEYDPVTQKWVPFKKRKARLTSAPTGSPPYKSEHHYAESNGDGSQCDAMHRHHWYVKQRCGHWHCTNPSCQSWH
jgi:hypothetical protein